MNRLIVLMAAIAVAMIGKAHSFDEVLYSIASNNAELKAQIEANESVVQSAKSENVLAAPEVGYEHNWSNRGLGTKWGFSVSQSFDWPGIYGKRGKAIDATKTAMGFLNKSNQVDKLLQIKFAIIDVVNINEQIELWQQLEQNMLQLRDKYQTAYQNGEVSILDVNKIKIQCVSVSRQLSQLDIQRQVLYSSLVAMNGGNDCATLVAKLTSYPADELKGEEEYVNRLNDFDPEIQYGQFMATSEVYKAKAARMNRYPGFSLGYKFTNELGDVFNGFKVGISLPFFSQKSKIKATQAAANAREHQLNQLRIEKLATIYAQRHKAISLKREIDEYKPIFDQSDNLNLLKKSLDAGQISLIEYLQEVNFFISARQDYMEVIYQYHLTLASLNKYWLIN